MLFKETGVLFSILILSFMVAFVGIAGAAVPTIPMDAYFNEKWQLFQPDKQIEIEAEVGGRVVLRAFYFTTEHNMYGTNVYGDNNGRGGRYVPPTGDIAAYNAQGQLTGVLAAGHRIDFQWYIAASATNDPLAATKLLYNHKDATQGFVISNVHEVDTSAHFLGTNFYFIELIHTAPDNVVKKYYSAPVKVTIVPFGKNSGYAPELITHAEESGWRVTSSTAQLLDYYDRLEKHSNGRMVKHFTGWRTLGRAAAPANATNQWAHLYRPSNPWNIDVFIFSDPTRPVRSPADVGDRMVALLSGNPHTGECEGKEGLTLFARELALGKWDDLLKDLVILVLPTTNLDGNDVMFAHRGSQYLPKLHGARFSGGVLNPSIGEAFNPLSESHSWYNLNRDAVKLDMPEARAIVDIFNVWNPAIFMDLHGMNGTFMVHSQLWNGALHPDTNPTLFDYNLHAFGNLALGKGSYLDTVQGKTSRLYAVGWNSLHPYLRNADNCEPRYITNYMGLRNRLGFLMEVNVHDPYPVRTDTQYASVVGAMQALKTDKARIEKMFADADAWARGRAQRGINPNDPRDRVTLRAALPAYGGPEHTADPTLIREMDFEAYLTNEATGAQMSFAINDPSVITIGRTTGDRVGTLMAGLPATLYKANDRRYYVPVSDGNMPGRVPLGAYYLFDKDAAGVAEILTIHGIEYSRLTKSVTIPANQFQWFNVTERRPTQTYYEGRLLATNPGGQTAGAASAWVGNWKDVTQPQQIPAGTYVVSTAQPLGNLAALMLEPGCVDGLMNWGFADAVKNPIHIKFFDDCYDRKEGTIRYNFKSESGDVYVPVFKVKEYIKVLEDEKDKDKIKDRIKDIMEEVGCVSFPLSIAFVIISILTLSFAFKRR